MQNNIIMTEIINAWKNANIPLNITYDINNCNYESAVEYFKNLYTPIDVYSSQLHKFLIREFTLPEKKEIASYYEYIVNYGRKDLENRLTRNAIYSYINRMPEHINNLYNSVCEMQNIPHLKFIGNNHKESHQYCMNGEQQKAYFSFLYQIYKIYCEKNKKIELFVKLTNLLSSGKNFNEDDDFLKFVNFLYLSKQSNINFI